MLAFSTSDELSAAFLDVGATDGIAGVDAVKIHVLRWVPIREEAASYDSARIIGVADTISVDPTVAVPPKPKPLPPLEDDILDVFATPAGPPPPPVAANDPAFDNYTDELAADLALLVDEFGVEEGECLELAGSLDENEILHEQDKKEEEEVAKAESEVEAEQAENQAEDAEDAPPGDETDIVACLDRLGISDKTPANLKKFELMCGEKEIGVVHLIGPAGNESVKATCKARNSCHGKKCVCWITAKAKHTNKDKIR